MENLNRGVVAVRKSSTQAFISWRLLGLDPSGIAFNIERSANGGAWTKLNGSPLTGGCNYTDTSANLYFSNAYRVVPVIGGVEQDPSESWILPANSAVEPLFRIPLNAPHDRAVHHVWPGDVDGDGTYELFASLIALNTTDSQKLAAYRMDGTFLWEVDFGPNSIAPDGVYPNAAAIAAGQWDGITVYDLDGDGQAEVIVKSANGVTFGDGTTLSYGDNVTQFISVLDGLTGAEKARVELPNPWKNDHNYPLGTLFGIGYADGVRPSLYIHAKNRTGGSGTPFNTIESAWDYRNGVITNRWSLQWNGATAPLAGHQIRVVDLDGDGKDDLYCGVHAVSSQGALMYNLASQGVGHGDRWHVGDLDPNRPGLEAYGIQQDNASGLVELMYDAATGAILWTHKIGSVVDAARGVVADIDPTYPGMENWSFYGTHTATGTEILSGYPTWPNLRIWWDADLLSETLDEEKIEKWNYSSQTVSRLLTAYNYGANAGARDVPALYGDILGDWREEMVYEKFDHTELMVFTTTTETTHRLYTLAHNPAYRNCMTVKGYIQENLPDYFLGAGMTTPPQPNITYVLPEVPAAPFHLTATASNNAVMLDWADNTEPDLAGYTAYRSTTSGSGYSAIASGLATSSHADTNVSNGTTYYYVVTATDNSSNESFYSTEASATPLPVVRVPIAVAATLPGVTVVNATGPTFATSATFDMADGNAVALLFTGELGSSGDAISATFAGQPMTMGVTTAEGIEKAYVFYLINPTTTSGQFVISTTGSGGDGGYSAIALSHVGGVAASNAVHNTATSGTITLNTTTAFNGGYVLGAAINNGWSSSYPPPSFVSGDADQVLMPPTTIDSNCGVMHSHGDVPTSGTSANVYGNPYQRNAYVTLAFYAGNSINTNPPVLLASHTGNMLTLSWPDHLGWTLQMLTNSLSTGFNTNWIDVPGSTGITVTNITVDPANPTVFYRLKL